MTMRPIRHLGIVGAMLVVVAACGGGSSGASTPTLPSLNETSAAGKPASTTTTMPVDPEEAFQEYTECMRGHGIDMPDPTEGGGVIEIGGDGFDLEAMEEAGAECDPILDAAFGEFEMSPEQEAEMMDQQLAFAQCMRDNGVDWPDPASDGSNIIELGVDGDPEAFEKAIETCDAVGATIIGGTTS